MKINTIQSPRKLASVKKLHDSSKTIIVINEHFTGTKTFKEKILDVMVRKLKNDK